MESTNSKRIALDGLRDSFDKTYAASDILDGKLQTILNFSSAIVAIASTVMASTLIDKVGISFWALLIVALVLYVLTVVIVMNGLKPRPSSFPISQTLDTIKSQYYEVTEDRALEQSIVDNLHYTNELEVKRNKPKADAVKRASWMMAIMVIILMLSIPAGLIQSKPTLSCVLHPDPTTCI